MIMNIRCCGNFIVPLSICLLLSMSLSPSTVVVVVIVVVDVFVIGVVAHIWCSNRFGMNM